jgi:3-oxoacyl-[acyl-carrier protein] reductase
MDLRDRTALVTGGGTGLGHEICVELARRGARVAVNYSRSRDGAEATVARLHELGAEACSIQADVSEPEAPARLLAEAERQLGPVDALVNNAGVTRGIPLADIQEIRPEDWQTILGVNIVGAFHCAQAAIPGMLERGGGSILNVASVAPFVATGSSMPYVVSKAGLLSLTECLSKALPPQVRVNAIAPGWMHTPWLERNLGPELLEQVVSGELPSVAVADVARASVELLVNDGVDGATLVIDGGERWVA